MIAHRFISKSCFCLVIPTSLPFQPDVHSPFHSTLPSPAPPPPHAGAVWAHRLAPVPIADPEVTKSVLYRNYLIPMAIDAIWEVMVKKFYGCSPLVVDHSDPSKLHGTYRSKLVPEERVVDFTKMTAAEVGRCWVTEGAGWRLGHGNRVCT